MSDPLQPAHTLPPQKISLAPAAPLAPPPAPAPVAPAPAPAAPAMAISPEQQTFFDRNKAYLAEGDHTYQTTLTPAEEAKFQKYLADKSDKQDLGREDKLDYDMRGWWKAMLAGDERAKLTVDPNDKLKHRNDYWKTPYHETFSGESQWAGKNAPKWNDKDQLVAPDGTILFDDKAKKK